MDVHARSMLPAMKIRSHLTLVVFGTHLPVLVLVAVLIVLYHAQMRRATEVGFEDTARAVSARVDREFEASIGALQVLAASEALRTGNLREFDRVVRTVLANPSHWTNLVLYDPTGRPLVSSLLPLATPSRQDAELLKRAAESRTPAISNLDQERPSGKLLVSVAVPVLAGSAPRYVLAASIDPASLVELLSQIPLPTGSVVSLMDRDYVIVARSRAAEQFVGQRATSDFVAQAGRARAPFGPGRRKGRPCMQPSTGLAFLGGPLPWACPRRSSIVPFARHCGS